MTGSTTGSTGRPGSDRTALGRASLHAWHRVLHGLEPIMGRLLHPDRLPWLRRLPVPPTRLPARLSSPVRPWRSPAVDVPAELRTQPGVARDPGAEDDAASDRPLRFFFALHADTVATVAGHMWPTIVSTAPRLMRSSVRLRAAAAEPPAEPPAEPAAEPAPEDPAALTTELRERTAALGISAVGVAAYDPRYSLAEYAGTHAGIGDGHRVIVLALEQNYDATQRIPAERSEQAAFSCYGELQERMVDLVRWLHDRGYTAHPESYIGESMFIHYAVAAGLGQLGINGQLLTPQAGSRCRLNVIHTDAPLTLDGPVDYGIEGICDRCQACVRRCPVGAIPAQRHEYRGITKAKLNTKRCLPIVTQAAGCSVCMKVCPVQAYGLDAVVTEYERSGEILGTHTDALEGYDWPLDGRHYAPGETPQVPAEVVRPPGYALDPDRVTPPEGVRPLLG